MARGEPWLQVASCVDSLEVPTLLARLKWGCGSLSGKAKVPALRAPSGKILPGADLLITLPVLSSLGAI